MTNSILGFDPSSLSVFRTDEKKSNFASNIYHPRPADSKSTDGIYRATLRIIYSPQNVQGSILERQSYAMNDTTGFFQVVSKLTNNDTSCPIFTAWKQCRYSQDPILQAQATPRDKGGNGVFEKRFERYVTIQVVDDPNNPDLNGSYMFWKLPKYIYDTIINKMKPSAESNKAPIPVMDFLFGRLVYLEITPGPDDPKAPERKTREISYSTTEVSDEIQAVTNPDKTSLLTAEQQAILDKYIEQMTVVWKSRNADDRQAKLAEVNADPNTAKLSEIYAEVIEKLKSFVPDLNAELGYKEWSAEMQNRVQNWINIVLAGGNPAQQAPVPADGTTTVAPNANGPVVAATPTPQPVTAAPAQPAAAPADDLPF